jgi:hypothetical protein
MKQSYPFFEYALKGCRLLVQAAALAAVAATPAPATPADSGSATDGGIPPPPPPPPIAPPVASEKKVKWGDSSMSFPFISLRLKC